MGIVEVVEVWDGRQGTVSERFLRTYRRRFRVVTDNQLIGPATVGDAIDPNTGFLLPRMYEYYVGPTGEADFGALLLKITVTQDNDNPCRWFVDCDYGPPQYDPAKHGDANHPGSGGQPSQQQHPLLRPPDIKWSDGEVEITLLTDVKDVPYMNTAGDRLDPPPTRKVPVQICTFSRNEASYYANTAYQYRFTVCSEALPPFAALESMMQGISADVVFEPQYAIRYFRVTYQIHCRVGGWKQKILNAGFNKKDGDHRTPIRDKNTGQPFSFPQSLDLDGLPLAVGVAPIRLEFDEYSVRSWAELQLGTLDVGLVVP